ncbi:MAG: hypothetical protein ACO3EN_06025, partial [Candidatus Nanopelagicales bacterium]
MLHIWSKNRYALPKNIFTIILIINFSLFLAPISQAANNDLNGPVSPNGVKGPIVFIGSNKSTSKNSVLLPTQPTLRGPLITLGQSAPSSDVLILENGNGSVVGIQGPQGPKGEQGIQGIQGIPGPAGSSGDGTGVAGPQG